MQGNRLYKSEKLCSRTAVDFLFKDGKTLFAYPLRATYRIVDGIAGESACVKFLITVPKKKLRHAVDRVTIRRRIRESYRLNRKLLLPTVIENHKSIEVAFIYLSSDIKNYASIEKKIQEILSKISQEIIANTSSVKVEIENKI